MAEITRPYRPVGRPMLLVAAALLGGALVVDQWRTAMPADAPVAAPSASVTGTAGAPNLRTLPAQRAAANERACTGRAIPPPG